MYSYYYSNNLPIYITSETKKITPSTFLDNGNLWEADSINYFYSQISPDKCYNIVDIGAQSGLYSLYAKYLPKSQFFSFEPFRTTFNLLNDNLQLNNILNVNTYNIGLSDSTGNAILNTSLSNNGLNTLATHPIRFNDIKQYEIIVDTLDNIFYNNNISVDFIKIDTEGWEYNILKGGIKTINKYKPQIQIEYNEYNMKQCNIDPNELLNFIKNELNYIIVNKIDEELYIKYNYNI